MVFDTDERVSVYLESFFCNLSLKSFLLGVIPDFDGDESEIEKMAKFNAAEAKSQKLGLRILNRKNNTGDWEEVAEIILVNRGRKDYFDLLQPYLAKNQVAILEKNDALAIQLIDYGNGLLKEEDNLRIASGVTITISKKNDVEALQARISALELALEGRLTNLAPNHFLGREIDTGVVQQVPFTRFATQSSIDEAIGDRAPLNNPVFTGIINNSDGKIQFPLIKNPSTNVNTLDDYEEGTFSPIIIGLTTEGQGTYAVQLGSFIKIGRAVLFELSINLSNHTGTGGMRICNLPYPQTASRVTPVVVNHNNLTLSANNIILATVINYVLPSTNISTASINLIQVPAGGGAQATIQMDTSAVIQVSGSYFAVT
ncbi:hypothetical protein QUB75_30835 [Microcoleus sp. K1-B6]|uniref:hypothetical protein n=1 Tax=unclassified Microcoleus TaxID=2642155 RepID=UPI002FD01D03